MLSTDQLLYIIPFIFSTLILAWNMLYAWKRRNVTGAKEFSIYVASELLWTTGFIMEMLSTSIEGKLFWDDFQFGGMMIGSFSYGVFILRYVNGTKITGKFFKLMMGISFPVIIYSITDSLHHTLRSNVQLIPSEPFDILSYDFNWGTYLLSAISYFIIISGVFLLAMKIFRSQREFVKQTSTVLLGIMIPMLGGFLTLSGVEIYKYRDISPFTFTVGSLIILWGLFKYGLFNMVPVAIRTVLDTIDDIVMVIDNERRLIFLNQAGKTNTGIDSKKALGKSVYDIFSKNEDLLNHFKGKYNVAEEVEILLPSGEAEQFMLKLLPLSYGNDQKDGRVVVLTNITRYKIMTEDLKLHKEQAESLVKKRTQELEQQNQKLIEEIKLRTQAEEKVMSNLEEKTILIQELNHRVRNNMSVILSLLNLQAQYLNTSECIKPITEIKNRIFSMSLVHEMMYHNGNFKQVSIREYLQGLYIYLYQQKRPGLELKFDIEIEDITLSIKKAIPLGLILNELIANAINHAFPEGQEGKILITGQCLRDDVTLSIKDDGIGFEVLNTAKSRTFGLRIVELLADQIQAGISFHAKNGTEVVLKFRKNHEGIKADQAD